MFDKKIEIINDISSDEIHNEISKKNNFTIIISCLVINLWKKKKTKSKRTKTKSEIFFLTFYVTSMNSN